MHGVNTITSTVYIVREHEDPGAIIHEMGHLFADLSITDPFGSIRRHDEWSWLGWEIALARQVGCFRAWSKQNATYGCGDLRHYQDRFGIAGQDWGALTRVEKELVIKDRIREARRLELINRQGHPQRSW